MAHQSPEFKSFNDFGSKDIDPEAAISRRMMRRLEDIDNPATPGPHSPDARAALASSVIAHAVVELEAQIVQLKRQLGPQSAEH